ncbi:MAG: glycosyltransferase family 39 protein [Bacteroidia bacterium]
MSNKLNALISWLKHNSFLAFAIIVIINLVFRLIGTDESSIYLDEAQTMFQAKRPLAEIIEEYVKKQQNAPLYFLILHFWIKTIGLSVFKVRFFSVIMMSLAAGMFYKLAQKIVSVPFAIGASLLFLGVDDFMNFAHEARGYALIAFLAVSSFYLLFSAIAQNKSKYLMWLIIPNLALLFTHYLTIYIFPVQFLIMLIWVLINKNWTQFKTYILSQVVVVIGFAPWLQVVFSVMPEKGEFWISEPTWNLLKNNYYYLVNGRKKTHILFWFISIATIAWIAQVKNRNAKPIIYLVGLALWAFIPVITNYFIGFHIPVFLAKYTFYASFGFVMLVGLLIYNFPITKWGKAALFMTAAIVNFNGLNFKSNKNENWKDGVEYIKTLEKNESTIIFGQRSYVYKAFCIYYDFETFKNSDNIYKSLEQDKIFFKEQIEELNKLEQKHQPEKIIFLRSHWKGSDPNGTLKKYLDNNYHLISENTDYQKLEIYEYLKN